MNRRFLRLLGRFLITPAVACAGVVSMYPSEIHAVSESEIGCLALNIYHEARGESLQGQMAVAAVTLNRVGDQRFPNTVCDVVWQPKQFSWTVSPDSYFPTDMVTWRKAVFVATRVYYSRGLLRPVGNATHYHSVRVQPGWSSSNRMQLVSRIGRHMFYVES
jgi:spore germination cell wall hydrolase CwlJ-like protein